MTRLNGLSYFKFWNNKWNDLVLQVVTGVKVGVEVNKKIGPYFCTYQGLRHREPLSPLIFDLASDAFAIMIERAIDGGILTGL